MREWLEGDAAGAHTFNAADQLTDAGTAYDADGNLTISSAFPAAGSAPGLGYNGVGQTTSITPAGQPAVPFTYAGAGQAERTSAASNFSQNGLYGVQTQTTAGATTSYINGPGGLLVERMAGGDFYYYFDGLGSVIGLVDPSGSQRATYTYDPYGANATATAANGPLPANPWRFVGGYLDGETGLYHFAARYYDPTMGRWTQAEAGTGYRYANNDPVNLFDPEGRSARVNCGIATCSIYFSKETTQYISDRSNEGTFGAGVALWAACLPLSPVASAACGLVGLVDGFVVAEAATRAAEKGGCLKITYLKSYPFPVTYVSSNTGHHCYSDFSEAYISHGNSR